MSIKFPRNKYQMSVVDVDDATKALLPEELRTIKGVSIINVELAKGAAVTVDGFGMPFFNPGQTSEWLLENAPIFDNVRLQDIIGFRTFLLLVPLLASSARSKFGEDKVGPELEYPYGQEHSWNPARYNAQFLTCRGAKFSPATTFKSDNDHVAVVSQSEIQDVWWLHQVAEAIRKMPLPVYLVPCGAVGIYHAIIPKPERFAEKLGLGEAIFEDAWRRFMRLGQLKLILRKSAGQWDAEDSMAAWNAQIIKSSTFIKTLEEHSDDKTDNDMIFVVHQPRDPENMEASTKFEPATFDNREAANEALKQSIAS